MQSIVGAATGSGPSALGWLLIAAAAIVVPIVVITFWTWLFRRILPDRRRH